MKDTYYYRDELETKWGIMRCRKATIRYLGCHDILWKEFVKVVKEFRKANDHSS